MNKRQLLNRIKRRADSLDAWLAENAPYVTADQKHLDENTPERAYWHHGYAAAMRDALYLSKRPKTVR